MAEKDFYGTYINEMPSKEELLKKRQINNPKNEPTGHFTGRCRNCGSSNLWDDNLTYGCNDCHALFCG